VLTWQAAAAPPRRERRDAAESQPATASTTGPATQPSSQASTRPTASGPKPIPLSFNNAPIGEIAKFLSDQMGKPVIPSKDPGVASAQITVVNPKPLPPKDAMYVLVEALHQAGIAIDEREHNIYLIPLKDIAQAHLKILGVSDDVYTFEPANQIVRKYFALKYYNAAEMANVVKPLLPDYSKTAMMPDPASGKLMILAPIEQLRVVAGIIKELDAPDVSGGEMRVFPIKNIDVNELLPMLERLVSSYLGVEVKAAPAPAARSSSSDRGYDGYGRYGYNYGGSSDRSSSTPPVTPSGPILVKGEKTPVMLIPDSRRSALIVVAPSKVLVQIEKWLVELDQPKPPSTDWEQVEVQFGDPDELANQLTNTLNSMPDESLRSAVRILPFGSSRKIMIIASEQNRAQVKKWLKDIDVPAGVMETKTFDLKNADAQQITQNIKELFQDMHPYSGNYGNFGSYYGGRTNDRTKVTVTSNTRSNSVTVTASPDRLAQIAERIKEWDRPLEGDVALPRTFDLKYADPEKTKTLLENLFTKKEQSNPFSGFFFGRDMPEAQSSPVGRLFGQFRFEAYPETGKLIVASKNEENYVFIEKLIRDIDNPQEVGIPRIIQLKFADAETLAEQLNALLNAPGTPASIPRRGQSGTFKELADKESMYSTNPSGGQQSGRQPQQQQQQQRNTNDIQFWWQNPPSDLIKNRQPSNLIGKLRIVPNVEQNLLMVVAPEGYAEKVEKFVSDLDRPGQQVLIKSMIAEITHDDTTSLGYRFSTDSSLFTTGSDAIITENAIRGLLNYNFTDTFGNHSTVTLNVDVNNLISLLRRVTNLKIRSEPKVFTADNVEAEFFDGQDIPFIKDSYYNANNLPQQSFDYKPVGIRLRVRPHITKERNIDLTVNLLVSSTIPGRTLFGGAIVDRRETTTRIVLEDGKTFLISGILREEENSIIRRIPGLGDIPLLGEVFKHREITKVNTELLIFLTPYVIGTRDDHAPIESEPLERLREQMDTENEFGRVGDARPKREHATTPPAVEARASKP